MNRVRIAVVGAGAIGKAHKDRVLAHRSAELACLVDPHPDARQLAADAGVRWFAAIEEMLAAGGADAAIVATPNHLHLGQTLLCIEHGLAVLVEKPLAATVAQAEQLCERVAALQARVLVGHHRWHSALLRQARSVVDSGRLGRLVAVQGTALFYKPDGYFEAGPWRTRAGGGPILINMVHEVGNLRFLCGEIAAVQAAASRAVRGFEVEDTAAMLLEFEGGALGAFLLSDCAAAVLSWEQTTGENRSYAMEEGEDCYVLVGTEGSLGFPSMRLRTFAPGSGKSWFTAMAAEQLPAPRNDPLDAQLDHFIAVVRGQALPIVSVQEGLQNLRVIDAIVAACDRQARVAVPQGRRRA